eukprot:CAMPEP_0194361168 /NCGR_PEP_ID=MMETSP0174-20130528/8733_1 /TAXON_ID=216777 /ORGANISM="Proboscia alata, Strain PI-D3" /LENGTH=497 /DNA_ID=CAMNT_0039133227 /DNA_START=12 /DNA_END=1505 /DNA_ORIENTATION=+
MAEAGKDDSARKTLTWVGLFLGELRDGLTMINMQSAFLIASKRYTEKQAGALFFVFGISQFLFQTPAGYIMDYSDKKVHLLAFAAIATTTLTVITAMTAEENGANLGWMIFIKFLQGAVTALIPCGLNSITQGIVGTVGMTQQVSRNEMMNHLGTAIIVFTGSFIAYNQYPDIGTLFIVSPISCIGVVYFLSRIKPDDIDHDAARGLVIESKPTDVAQSGGVDSQGGLNQPAAVNKTTPSFNFGFSAPTKDDSSATASQEALRADTPLQVMRDPILLTFTLICFLFHAANGCILPLVMQSLALEGGRSGILLSGFCIIVAQTFMVGTAKICGEKSALYGRKILFLIGFFSVPLRCLILTGLLYLRDLNGSSLFLQIVILSTQVLDGIGAGAFGTMYILVTSDISGGTGRFSLTLGITTAAMSIGGTVSGYLGETLAEDLGYREAFMILGLMALVPALLYLFCMPETLPAYNTPGANAQPDMTKINEDEEGTNYVELT